MEDEEENSVVLVAGHDLRVGYSALWVLDRKGHFGSVR